MQKHEMPSFSRASLRALSLSALSVLVPATGVLSCSPSTMKACWAAESQRGYCGRCGRTRHIQPDCQDAPCPGFVAHHIYCQQRRNQGLCHVLGHTESSMFMTSKLPDERLSYPSRIARWART